MDSVERKTIARKCVRCGHVWDQRNPSSDNKPRQCPNCKSPRWDRPARRSGVAPPTDKKISRPVDQEPTAAVA